MHASVASEPQDKKLNMLHNGNRAIESDGYWVKHEPLFISQ
jgi:hypothetical protein